MKYKGEIVNKSGAVQRIMHYVDSASASQLEAGMNWYGEANSIAQEMVETSRDPINMVQASAIISALSPTKGWNENVKLAKRFVKGEFRGHTSLCIGKAKAIYLNPIISPIEAFYTLSTNGVKTSHFFMNIMNPGDERYVTIDRHAIAVVMQNINKTRAIPESFQRMTPLQYTGFCELYRSAAKKLNLLPSQVQAISWGVYRGARGLKY